MTGALRIVGALLVAFSTVPIFRLLGTSEEAPHRQASVDVAEATLAFFGWGTLVILLLGAVLAFVLPGRTIRARLEAAGDRLASVPMTAWAVGLASASGVLALLIQRLLYRGFFTNVDEIASTLQARYIAAGLLGGRLPGTGEAWMIPNMLLVPEGWVSHFAPAHLFVMALFHRLGLAWLLGPLALALTVGFTALALPRLLPDLPRTARVGALAVALSPFVLLVGAGSLSHTTAGAAGVLALYASLRARDGSWSWSLVAGSAIGFMVAGRPWTGLVLGSVATLGIWVPELVRRRRPMPWMISRGAGTLLGGLPFAVFLGWYNTRLFGAPTRLGYLAAFGDRHRLGFHTDPWSYDYGPLEALGFTSTDVLAAGVQLLETPVPLGLVIGLFLLTARRLPRGVPFLVAWALLPVVANAYYWFHDPRMLYEAAPAWLALGVVAAIGLGVAPASGPEGSARLRARLNDVALWSALLALLAAGTLGVPSRLASYRWSDATLARVTVPSLPDPARALVFVHASWNERLASTLQVAGRMRQDSVITVLRRNTNCGLQRYTTTRTGTRYGMEGEPLPPVELEQLPGTPEGIERPRAPEGTTVRMRPGVALPAECVRELEADRFGAVALAPLVWQGDLPGIERGRPMFVRDLGPEKNRTIRSYFPDRTPYVLVPKADGAPPQVVPYGEAMQVLWREAAGG
jgi:hypothetical protein